MAKCGIISDICFAVLFNDLGQKAGGVLTVQVVSARRVADDHFSFFSTGKDNRILTADFCATIPLQLPEFINSIFFGCKNFKFTLVKFFHTLTALHTTIFAKLEEFKYEYKTLLKNLARDTIIKYNNLMHDLQNVIGEENFKQAHICFESKIKKLNRQ